MDLPFGRLRIAPVRRAPEATAGWRTSSRGSEARDVPRLRFGVGRPQEPAGAAEHVLQRFSPDEEQSLPGRIERAARAVAAALFEGVTPAMNAYNRDPAPEDGAENGG